MNDATQTNRAGKLVCIGTGICSLEQLTVVSKNYLERADVVFGVMPNYRVDDLLQEINPNYVNMQKYYAQGKPRGQTYMEMANAMIDEVRAGKDVCCALYGHPGVFACIAHLAIGLARKAGFAAKMEPGISAEDCLFADLGLNPGYHGCLSYEATQLLFYKHTVDPSAVLVLWQISLAGEHTSKTFSTTNQNLQLTVGYLNQWYDLEHEVIVYEAAFLPAEMPRIDRMPLKNLPDANLTSASTLVIMPKEQRELNPEVLAKFGLTEADLSYIEEFSS
jgi:uncharacterized protein YabN with tetrapyrrole methylase and pyrophosphatase domain